MFWIATEYSVSNSVKNAMAIVKDKGFASAAFPLIGAGSGNRSKDWSLKVMLESFSEIKKDSEVILVKYKK